jgi:arylsulfatase A-like enzyme
VNGDHGSRYRVVSRELKNLETEESDNLAWAAARSRALLLIKPIKANNRALVSSRLESSLLDIYPTILDSIEVREESDIDGFSLLNPGNFPADRIRYYYAYDKQTEDEWTDKLHQFVIENGQIKFVKDIPVKSN